MQHRTQEQIADSLVPPIMEAVLPSTPQERVQNLTQEQVMDFPVPQNMRDYAGVVRATPQELVQNRSFVRQTTKEIGDGVQHVPSKRMPERHRDSNINCSDKYNMPCAGVVSDMIPAGFVRVADVFRPLSHGRTRDVSVKREIAVKKGPKRVFVDSGRPTRLRGRLRRWCRRPCDHAETWFAFSSWEGRRHARCVQRQVLGFYCTWSFRSCTSMSAGAVHRRLWTSLCSCRDVVCSPGQGRLQARCVQRPLLGVHSTGYCGGSTVARRGLPAQFTKNTDWSSFK